MVARTGNYLSGKDKCAPKDEECPCGENSQLCVLDVLARILVGDSRDSRDSGAMLAVSPRHLWWLVVLRVKILWLSIDLRCGRKVLLPNVLHAWRLGSDLHGHSHICLAWTVSTTSAGLLSGDIRWHLGSTRWMFIGGGTTCIMHIPMPHKWVVHSCALLIPFGGLYDAQQQCKWKVERGWKLRLVSAGRLWALRLSVQSFRPKYLSKSPPELQLFHMSQDQAQ